MLAYFLEQPWFYEALGMQKSLHAALVVFSILNGSIALWISPLSSHFSRKHEFEADQYAVDIIGTGAHLREALIGLTRETMSAPQPHPLYSKFFYSHPPLSERLAAVERVSAARTS